MCLNITENDSKRMKNKEKKGKNPEWSADLLGMRTARDNIRPHGSGARRYAVACGLRVTISGRMGAAHGGTRSHADCA
jgi:hypothetical protein